MNYKNNKIVFNLFIAYVILSMLSAILSWKDMKKMKLTEIEIKIKDEKLKRHVELLEVFREVQKQEFYKAIEEISKKP